MTWRFGILLLTLWLAGCAGWGVSGHDDGERWALSGKLGLRQADQAESVLLNWSQCGEHYRLILSGPLGQQLARVQGGPEGALFWTNKADPEYTTSPRDWLDQRLGWPLPIGPLQYWIRGLPAPDSPATREYDADHQLQKLQQDGWQIEYLERYRDAPSALPRRLRVSQGDRVATLVIRHWQLGTEVQSCPSP